MSGWRQGESDPESHPLGRPGDAIHPIRAVDRSSRGLEAIGWWERRASYSCVYSTTTGSVSRRRRKKGPRADLDLKKQCVSKSMKHATKRGLGLGWGCGVPERLAVVCPLKLTRSSARGWCGVVLSSPSAVRAAACPLPPTETEGDVAGRTAHEDLQHREARAAQARAQSAPPLPAPVTVITHTTKAPTLWMVLSPHVI